MNWLAAARSRYRVASDPLRLERRIELGVLGLAVLFVLQLVYGATRLAFISAPNAVPPSEDSLRVLPANEVAAVSAEQSNEIRQRPVLWPERKPVEAVAEVDEPQKASQQEIKDIKLVGVFGEGSSVGIIAKLKDKTRRIHVGEDVSGWTLQSVGTNEAVLTQGKRQETLVLYPGPGVQAPPSGKANHKARVSENRESKHKQ